MFTLFQSHRPTKQGCEELSTAAVERGYRLILPSLLIISLGMGLIDLPLRASNEGVLDRVLRERGRSIVSIPLTHSSRGIRRHEHYYFETLACVILHAVLFPGWRHGPCPGPSTCFSEPT